MPNFEDLLDELIGAGVRISAAAKLAEVVSLSDNWIAAFVEVSRTGRRIGVTMTRRSAVPTDQVLQQILGGYPFDREQRDLVVQNILETSTVDSA